MQMPSATTDQLVIEKTPGYFSHPKAPQRIHLMNKRVRLIVVFRHPVRRAISDYVQTTIKRKRKWGKQSFEQKAIFKNGSINTQWPPIKRSRYAEHIEPWLRQFSRQRFLFLSGETLVKSPASQVIKMQQFLDLPIVLGESDFVYNKTKGFPCFIKKPTGRDSNYALDGGNGTSRPGGRPGDSVSKSKCFGEDKGRPHPTVDPAVIEKLTNYFSVYNKKLYSLIGIDFNWV